MVEYGADLHTMDHGSGFPTVSSKNLSKEDEVYAKVNIIWLSSLVYEHLNKDPWVMSNGKRKLFYSL